LGNKKFAVARYTLGEVSTTSHVIRFVIEGEEDALHTTVTGTVLITPAVVKSTVRVVSVDETKAGTVDGPEGAGIGGTGLDEYTKGAEYSNPGVVAVLLNM
jgi:hypothetical protein